MSLIGNNLQREWASDADHQKLTYCRSGLIEKFNAN